MTKPCDHCGANFSPRSSRGRYCSDKCRNASGYLRRNGVDLPALRLAPSPDTDPGDGTLTSVTLRDVRGFGVEDTIAATLALILARAIDAGVHTGSGLTALTREYGRVWADITAAAAPVTEDPLARLRRQRNERRAKGQTN